MNEKKTWGGARLGAGRPRKKEKRIPVALRVLPETKDRMRRLRADGYDVNEIVDQTIEIAAHDLLLEKIDTDTL